jgi:hypothetical protein
MDNFAVLRTVSWRRQMVANPRTAIGRYELTLAAKALLVEWW